MVVSYQRLVFVTVDINITNAIKNTWGRLSSYMFGKYVERTIIIYHPEKKKICLGISAILVNYNFSKTLWLSDVIICKAIIVRILISNHNDVIAIVSVDYFSDIVG